MSEATHLADERLAHIAGGEEGAANCLIAAHHGRQTV